MATNKAMQTNLDTGLAYEIEVVFLTFATEDKEEGSEPEFKGR